MSCSFLSMNSNQHPDKKKKKGAHVPIQRVPNISVLVVYDRVLLKNRPKFYVLPKIYFLLIELHF